MSIFILNLRNLFYVINGYGSPVSIYYGDALLYIPAVLRIIGFTFNTAYKLFIFLVNLGTSVISFFAFRSILGGSAQEEHAEKIALVLSLAYTCAPYRLMDLYLRVSVGEYLAIMFFPLVVLGLYRIFSIQQAKNDWKGAVILGVGMASILITHLLSFQMVLLFVVASVIIAIIARKMTLARLKALILAAFASGMLSLFFLVPFVDSYLHNKTVISARVQQTAAIQKKGAFVGQLFAFFQDIFGYGHRPRIEDRMYLSIGMVLSFVILFAIVMLVRKKQMRRKELLWLVLSLLTLFMSTDCFPWNRIARIGKLGNMR